MNLFKEILKATLYRPGKVARVFRGPLRGAQYRLNELSGWSALYNGYEPESLKIFSRLVKKGEVVYDLGANTGIFSLAFSRLIGEGGKVFAFEPLPENLAELEFLIRINGLRNVSVIPKAVSNFIGRSRFYLGANPKEGSLPNAQNRSGKFLEVEVVSLDQVISSGLPPPDFLKMDIEGEEGAALEGFSQCISRSYPHLSIDLHLDLQDPRIGNFLQAQGYRIYRLGDALARRYAGQREFLSEVTAPGKWFPEPDGIWGHLIALHPSRKASKDDV